MEFKRKPFVGCDCVVHEPHTKKSFESQIVDWKYDESTRSLRFQLSNDWWVNYKDVEINSERGATIKSAEILTNVRNYLSSIQEQNVISKKESLERVRIVERDGKQCPKSDEVIEDPYILRDPADHDIRIGDMARINEFKGKPFVGCVCVVHEPHTNKFESKIVDWKYDEGTKSLRFQLSNTWWVNYKDIDIKGERGATIKSEQILKIVRNYLSSIQEQSLERVRIVERDGKQCPKSDEVIEDPYILRDPPDHGIRIGDMVRIDSRGNEKTVIVRWTGVNRCCWRALVEYVESDGKGGELEGEVDGQRLWYPEKGGRCDLVPIDKLKIISKKKELAVSIETKKLESPQAPRYLGCKVKCAIRQNEYLNGRVLWTGLIQNYAFVLVETDKRAVATSIPPPFGINPVDIYPSAPPNKDLILFPCSSITVNEDECRSPISGNHKITDTVNWGSREAISTPNPPKPLDRTNKKNSDSTKENFVSKENQRGGNPSQDPYLLRDPADHEIRIGDVVLMIPQENEKEEGLLCIVRWTGLNRGRWRALVEYINSDGNGGEFEGQVDGQRLWHPEKGKLCEWVPIERLKIIEPREVPKVPISTEQLHSPRSPRHLGCEVRIPIGTNVYADGRVLWMGHINTLEYVLLETYEVIPPNCFPAPMGIEPRNMYPAIVYEDDRKRLYLVPCSCLIVVEHHCRMNGAVTSVTQPARGDIKYSQPPQTTQQPVSQISQIRKYVLRYQMTKDTAVLRDFCLGNRVKVRLLYKEWDAILCWIGSSREGKWFVGVEIDPQADQDHLLRGTPSTNGIFDNQRLWFPFQQESLCFLVPIEDADLPWWSGTKNTVFNSLRNMWTHAELHESGLILGQHVMVDSRKDSIACVVWTGMINDDSYAVVKMAMNDEEFRDERNIYDPKDLAKFDKISGFYGKVKLLPLGRLTAFKEQLHIPHIETEMELEKKAFTTTKNCLRIYGRVKWYGKVDGRLYYGMESTATPPVDMRPDALVLAGVSSKMKKSIEKGTCLWILLKEDVNFSEYDFKAMDLPRDLKPLGFGLKKQIKVELNDSVTYFGEVTWRGQVNDQWLVAVQVDQPLPPQRMFYPGLAKELNLPSNYTLFVTPWQLSPVYERDLAATRPQSFKDDRVEAPPPNRAPVVQTFNGVVYHRGFFENLNPLKPSESGLQFQEDYLIEVELDPSKGKRAGVCRYVGMSKESAEFFIGVELMQKTSDGGTDGRFPDANGVALFTCRQGCGIVVPVARTHSVNLSIPLRPGSIFGFPVASDRGPSGRVIKVWCDVPHSRDFFDSLRFDERPPEDVNYKIGYLVEVNMNEGYHKPSGQCRWFGVDPSGTKSYVGVALDQPIHCEATTDGEFFGRRLFSCERNCGVLLPRERVLLHRDIIREMETTEANVALLPDKLKGPQRSSTELTQGISRLLACDFSHRDYVKGFHELSGIQGRQNSCYMDTTLFAMFALNSSFDGILSKEICETSKVIHLLREGIVNILRRDYFVPATNMVAFRQEFEAEGKTQGMRTNQKDPEEFLVVLFEKIAKIPYYLHYKDGNESHILQLLFFLETPRDVVSVQEMVDLTFQSFGPDVKLTQLPTNLIMQIPRDGQSFYDFRAVKHTISLDMTQFIDETVRRRCCGDKCNGFASYGCSACHALCDGCAMGLKNKCHCGERLKKIYVLELYAVLCIEISHYVAFLRINKEASENDTPSWLFYDSMHNRQGEINIPHIEKMDDGMEQWVKDFKSLDSIAGKSEYYKRLAKNPYVLFYRDPRRCMYQFAD